MFIKRRKALLFVAGEGGHMEQMSRLLRILEDPAMLGCRFCILMTSQELSSESSAIDLVVRVPEIRKKYGRTFLFTLFYRAIKNFYVVCGLFLRFDIRVVITTGPGIAVLPGMIGRMLRLPVVFIETWSRFMAPSLTGKVMGRVATTVYYQNKELAPFFANGVYSGRL